MPWKERNLAQMREEFVLRAQKGEATKSALCKEYGITRRTGDKWIARYKAGQSLENQSRRPFHTPKKTDAKIEEKIVAYRKEHPAIGAVKIQRILINKGEIEVPSAKTVNNILKRNGLITREASAAATPYQRYEKSAPNEMWQADFKGYFALQNGQRCHPLDIIDDYSRFNLCCKAMGTETFEEIRPVMIRVFEEYGMPFSLLCDNGNPWGTSQSTGFSRFEVWLMEHGILVLHGKPLHPQTQGKEERFNGTLKKELLRHHDFSDMLDADEHFAEYRTFYNNERPHHALNLDVPAKHYKASERQYTETVGEWEYPDGCKIHKVKSTGYITLNGGGYFLSESFGEKAIAIRESHQSGCYDLYFRQFHIGRIDIEKRVFTFKRAYLIDGDPRQTDTKAAERK